MVACEVCGGPCNNKHSVCRQNKDCRREYRRRAQDALLERLGDYRPDNWSAVLEQARRYQQSKREEDLTWHQRDCARRRERHLNNQDEEREYNRAWRQGNPGRVRAQARRYRRRYREKLRAQGRERYRADRDRNLKRSYDYRFALHSTVQGTARLMFLGARARASKAGIPFDLTAEWVESELAFTLEAGCPLLGIEVTLHAGRRSPSSPSIDRFRPELGYVQDNCWIISWAANRTKRDMTIDFVRKVVALAETRFRDVA